MPLVLTEKQTEYLQLLLDQKVETDQHANWWHHINQITDRLVLKRAFDTLKAAPRLAAHVPVEHKVYPGLPQEATAYYALPDGEGFDFYRVDRPTEGNWAGFTFLKIQASDDFFPIKDVERKNAVLTAIASDPLKALTNYGKQIGRCGLCGRTLTHEDSIARGIGPVCAGKL